MTVRAYLGLGANLGDPLAQLRAAVAAIDERTGVSSVYRTEPVGGPPGQPDFLNLVVALDTRRSPRQLLELAQSLEQAAWRVRDVRHGPRTLDVDVLLVGAAVVNEPDLVVPHPRMWERRFVLMPLAELDPAVVPATALELAGGKVEDLGRLVQ